MEKTLLVSFLLNAIGISIMELISEEKYHLNLFNPMN